MVSVNSYIRYSPKGRAHRVSSHNRSVKRNRGDYNIEKERQHEPKSVNLTWDRMIQAKEPGKRMSGKKNIYYERRFNRSDKGEWL